MSNSARAKLRRSKRSHLNKHQRGVMAKQHWNDSQAVVRERRREADTGLAKMLGIVKGGEKSEQKADEPRD